MATQSTPRTHKRKERASKACDYCRKKKLRCRDRPCSNCIANNIECTWDLPRRKRGPRPKSKQSQNPEPSSNLREAPISYPHAFHHPPPFMAPPRYLPSQSVPPKPPHKGLNPSFFISSSTYPSTYPPHTVHRSALPLPPFFPKKTPINPINHARENPDYNSSLLLRELLFVAEEARKSEESSHTSNENFRKSNDRFQNEIYGRGDGERGEKDSSPSKTESLSDGNGSSGSSDEKPAKKRFKSDAEG